LTFGLALLLPPRPGRFRRLLRRRAQILVAHVDALAVGRDHDQVLGLLGLHGSLSIEAVEVPCRPHRALFDLALAKHCAGPLDENCPRLLERTSSGMLGHEPLDPVRMYAFWQVQRGVQWVQTLEFLALIRQPHRVDRAEDRRQRPPLTGTRVSSYRSVCAPHFTQPPLLRSP